MLLFACFHSLLNCVLYRQDTTTLTATKTSLEIKWICDFSISIVIISPHLLCQMQANSSRAEFLTTISKFRKKKKILSSLVYVLYKTWKIRIFHVVVLQWRQRNVQDRVMHVQSCCFTYSTFLTVSLSSPSWNLLKLPFISECTSSVTMLMGFQPGGGGGGTAKYGLYRYVPRGRVWFSSSLL